MEKSNPNFLYASKPRSNSRVFSLSTTHGFTIVELLVVIVVIGVLAAITIVSYTGMSQKATIASLTSDLDNASRQIKLYQVTSIVSSYPASLDANYCPIPADTARCLKPSPGTTYQYSADNSTTPQSFCITATKSNQNYKITNDRAPVAGVCLDYGLVLSLDAGNLTSYSGSGTTWTDLSGNNNNGTLVNGTGYVSPNIHPNDANLVFDGVNDGVSLPTITPNIAVTFNAFIYINGTNTNYGTIFSNWGSGGNAYYIGTTNGASSVVEVYFNGSRVATISLLPMNTWMMLTVTHNSNTAVGYINAVQQFSVASTLISSATNVSSVGYDVSRTNYPFKGSIAMAQIYNRALPAAEILQNFNALKGRYGL